MSECNMKTKRISRWSSDRNERATDGRRNEGFDARRGLEVYRKPEKTRNTLIIVTEFICYSMHFLIWFNRLTPGEPVF